MVKNERFQTLHFFRFHIYATLMIMFFSLSAIAADNEETVVQRFVQILEKNPREGTTLDKVYGYYAVQGRLGELLERYEKLASCNPDDATKRLLLGLLYEKSGKENDALKNYEIASKAAPNDFYVNYYQGRILLRRGSTADAEKYLKRAIESSQPQLSEYVDAAVALGKTYVILGDIPKFDTVLERVAKKNADDDTAILNLIEILENEKYYDEAIERYASILDRLKPENMTFMSVLLARANALSKAGRFTDASDDYEFILDNLRSDHPFTEKVYSGIENMYAKRGDTDGLIAFYEKRFIPASDNSRLVHRFAAVLQKAGHLDEAEGILSKTLASFPHDTALRLQLINVLAKKHNYDEVEKQFDVLKEMVLYNVDHIVLRGEIALRNTKYAENERKKHARDIWNEIAKHDPDDTAAFVFLSHLFDAAGMPEDAEKILRMAPGDPDSTAFDFEKLVRIYNKPGNEKSTVGFYARSFLDRPEIVVQDELLDLMFGDVNDATLRDSEILVRTIEQLKLKHPRQSIIERLEIRLNTATQSVNYVMREAGELISTGEDAKAAEILVNIAPKIPQESKVIMEYASLLEKSGLKNESLVWKTVAFRLDPKLFFGNSDRYTGEYVRQGSIDLMYEMLFGLDDATLLGKADIISGIAVALMWKDEQKNGALEFFDKLWRKNFADEERTLQYRIGMLKGAIWSSHKELYPYYHEIVLKLISPNATAGIENRNESFCNPHWIVAWGADQCRSISFGMLATIPENEIETLSNEVDRIIKKYDDKELPQSDMDAYSYAVVMKALLMLKTGEHDKALSLLKNLEKNEHTIVPLTYCGAVLGQECAAVAEKKCTIYALQCFQRYRTINRHSYGEVFLGMQIDHLQSME